MAGGKSIGIPLKPKYQVAFYLIQQNKKQILERCKDGFVSGEQDEWEINYEEFEKALNPRTKAVLINSPHNPVGKVFSQE